MNFKIKSTFVNLLKCNIEYDVMMLKIMKRISCECERFITCWFGPKFVCVYCLYVQKTENYYLFSVSIGLNYVPEIPLYNILFNKCANIKTIHLLLNQKLLHLQFTEKL